MSKRHAIILNVEGPSGGTDSTAKVIRLKAHVVDITDEGNIRNPMDDGYADLYVTAQADLDRPESGWYALKLEYRDAFARDLEDIEKQVKLLRKVKRHFVRADMEYEFRWGNDVERYLTAVSGALDLDGFLLYEGENGTGRWGYDGSRYRWLSTGEAAEWVEAHVK